MKNLKLLYSASEKIDTKSAPTFLLLSDKSEVFVVTEKKLLSFNPKSNGIRELGDLNEFVISCEYLSLNDEICLALSTGEVLLYKRDTWEEVTYCDGGLEMMSWSPNQEIVAFVTKQQTLVLMNSNYDVISEANLTEDEFGKEEFVNIGWGKKETQFHGSEGKSAAKVKSDFTIPDLSDLSKKIGITWRGDGELFAVSFVGSFGRCFKVFDREGNLKFTSEKVNGLQELISWRPSGSWIAVPHKLPNKSVIDLFEKNGLRHREILLPFDVSEDKIIGMKWNSVSDLLAIATQKSIYIYTIGNYHWYLKQFLEYDSKIADFTFDYSLNKEYTLHVVLETADYIVYNFDFDIDHSFEDSDHNQAIVAVIDGPDLLLTDFRNNVIPPPMFKQKITENACINACGFLRNASSPEEHSYFFTLCHNNTINFYKCVFEKTDFGQKMNKIEPLKTLGISVNNTLNSNSVIWIKKDLLSVSCYESQGKTSIKFLDLDGVIIHSLSYDGILCALSHYAEDLLAHTTEKEVLIIGPNTFEIRESVNHICNKISTFGGHVVAFRNNSHLYVSGTSVSDNVTSYFVTSDHLIFTQFDVMKFISLTNLAIVDERRIERGAKVIVVVQESSKVIMQMPRGNLEGINPRILSLRYVGKLLDGLKYKEAFDILRKERINLNIICDHNIPLFFENFETFIKEITNVSWLNLFLSDLKNEDFTTTMYSGSYSYRSPSYPSDENFSITKKVDLICSNLCELMVSTDHTKYILPIITSLVKTNQMEKALKVIWDERQKEHNHDANKKSEEALSYLLFLVNVNDLYDVALGMYDFGLVLFVASKSQKDPKEFIPLLNELEKYDENYRKFKIDEHLKKYEKALEHIAKCSEEKFPEALAFIEKHKVFRKALTEYKGKDDCYRKICLSFADHLRLQGKLENASIMYERAGDIDQAIQTAKNVLDWRRCIVLCEQEQLEKLCSSLIFSLNDSGQYEDAFYIQKNYCNNLEGAIQILLSGKLFLKAIFECKAHNKELLGTLVGPEIENYFFTMKEVLTSDKELFLKYKTRLITVREVNSRNDNADYYEPDLNECDILSVTSSMKSSRISDSSSRTGKTFRSSKNRRKHERKLLSLKEGNPFEDIALINVLFDHIIKISGYQMHVRETCKALLEISKDHEARDIQLLYKGIMNMVNDSLNDIWIEEIQSFKPHINNISIAQIRNEERYSMLDPIKRFKPVISLGNWEHEILK